MGNSYYKQDRENGKANKFVPHEVVILLGGIYGKIKTFGCLEFNPLEAYLFFSQKKRKNQIKSKFDFSWIGNPQ